MWLDMKQDSPEWHGFRSKHIGASEVPSLMGTCDFRTPEDLFKAKVFGETFEGNFATQRGKTLEPIILSIFEETKNVKLTQPTIEYKEWPILSASLDGWIKEENAVVEVKAPAIWKHCENMCGIIPKTYADQLQAQMLVAEADIAYFVTYSPDEIEGFQFHYTIVKKNTTRQIEILNRAKKMWEMIEAKEFIPFPID